jgi:hypothetical protein
VGVRYQRFFFLSASFPEGYNERNLSNARKARGRRQDGKEANAKREENRVIMGQKTRGNFRIVAFQSEAQIDNMLSMTIVNTSTLSIRHTINKRQEKRGNESERQPSTKQEARGKDRRQEAGGRM